MSKKRQNGKAKKVWRSKKKKYERNNSRLRRWGRLLKIKFYQNVALIRDIKKSKTIPLSLATMQ